MQKKSQAGARFIETNLARARFHNVNLTDAKIRGAMLVNTDIDGFIHGLRVNGVLVAPLIRAELDRLYPEHALLRATDPAGMREAWAAIEKRWARTMTRARKLPEATLRARVDGEWSFVETLRHLIFVTDAWISRTVLGARDHYDPIGLANTDQPVWFPVACRLDPKAKPTLDEVLTSRRSRMAVVRSVVDGLTEDELARRCKRNPSKGYPADPRRTTVLQCLQIVLNEEWEHHRFVVRDLDALAAADPKPSATTKPTAAPGAAKRKKVAAKR